MLFYPIHHRHDPMSTDLTRLLGGKGAGLTIMAGELGLPVPPGFTITTDACRSFQEHGWTAELEQALRRGITGIEAETGRRFGDATNPLLVSVRSGAPVSMPGMLDTILNVGLNETTQRGLDFLGPTAREECKRNLAAAYLHSVGGPPPDDPWAQLRGAVEAVFRSAASRRADAYRRRTRLSDDPITAVNVQIMVFGNRDRESATGVVFSRDPATGENRLYGDLLFRAQGEEVVSGRRQTDRIEILADLLPDVAKTLGAAVRRLEKHFRDLCEVEFTVENGELWLLQVRIGKRSPRAALRIAIELAEDPDFPVDRAESLERVASILADPPRAASIAEKAGFPSAQTLAQGLGASPGFASGVVAIDLETLQHARASGQSVILVRPETSPEDVEAMSLASGLLTARGGLASHAAVIARGWGTPAVVGVEALSIDDRGIVLAGRRFEVGDVISLDGSSGAIYPGSLETVDRVVPEAVRLLEWARELGITIGQGTTTADAEGTAPCSTGPIGAEGPANSDEAIAILGIKGFTTREMLAASLGVAPQAAEAVVEELLSAGLVTTRPPHFVGLTESGSARSAELLEVDRGVFGPLHARRALDEFQALDTRAKSTVTDWQLRPVGGELVPNDHSDAAWDEAVFERLAMLFDEVNDWLGEPARSLPRLQRYRARLARALDAARGGDGRYVASPRVDSFHGVWFELHEDLIRLANRTRREEVGAGRAG